MSCNAYGHPPTCECGWGGVNHDPWRPKISPDWSRASSHTIPNARCPVCQNKVFFYRSPEEGAVFFDNLGPPWPKHLCTDRSLKINTPGGVNTNKKKNKRKKKIKQWWPYPCEKAEALPNNEGTCLYGEDGKRLFIKTKAQNIPPHTPIWLRQSPDAIGKYDVSTFKLKDGTPVNVGHIGYSAKGISTPEMADQFHVTRKEILGLPETLDSQVEPTTSESENEST